MTKNKIKILPNPPSGQTKGDMIHSTAKALTGLVPFAGSAISEAIDKAIRAPAEMRMNHWLGLVTETINELIAEANGPTLEDLGSNSAFTTAVIATTRTAMLTEREEKIFMLQSILHTMGGGFILNEILRNTFLAAIDRYTPEHILLLKKCADNNALTESYHIYNSSQKSVSKDTSSDQQVQVEFLIPWLLPETSADIAKELFSDLHRDRFCNGSEGWAYTFKPDISPPVTTVRGQEFLRFIYGP